MKDDYLSEDKSVTIERGTIKEKKAGPYYKVESMSRDKIKTRWIRSINEYIVEYEGEPPRERKFQYDIGDEVYYFMFPDGRGMILGKMERG